MLKRRYIYLIFLLAFILLITGCDGGGGGFSKPDFVNIQGRVSDYTTGDPIQYVTVTINDTYTYTTGDSSNYSFTNIPNNDITITAVKEGYWPEIKNNNLFYDKNVIMNFYLKDEIEYSGSISGNITMSSGLTSLATANNSLTDINISSIKPKLNNSSSTNLQYVEGEVLVKFRDTVNSQQLMSHPSIGSLASTMKGNNTYKIKTAPGVTTDELYNYYNNLPEVQAVTYNYKGYLLAIPYDPYHTYQWHLDNMNLYNAWDIQTGSKGITVAVIDTGYIPHPDLNGNIDTYNDWDFVDNDGDATDIDSYYNSGSDYRESHGTHVAGIIGAVGNNNLGVTGANWNVNLLPLRIFQVDNYGNQYFSTDALFDAIYYAVDEANADVINLSLAYVTINLDPAVKEYIDIALKHAYDNGVTVVAAAGNSGKSSVFYPASSYYTIAVGASNINDELASYSNYGSKLDILAPGGDDGDVNNDGYVDGVLSTMSFYNTQKEEYSFMIGTSMASPQVAGVAALLKAAGAGGPEEIKQILHETSTPINDSRLNGAGLINAYKALSSITGYNPYSEINALVTTKDGNTYYVWSDYGEVNKKGDYYINHAKIGIALTIIGWVDNNDNNKIDNEDFFGEYYTTFELDEGEHRSNIDFNISTNGLTNLQSVNDINLIFSPPLWYKEKGE